MDCNAIFANRQREELAIVGAVLFAPHALPSAIAALGDVPLADPHCSATLTAIGELRDAGQDVNGASVAHAVVVATGWPRHVVVQFLASVAEAAGTASTIPRHAQAIREAAAALELRDLGKELRDITPREISSAAHYIERLRTINKKAEGDVAQNTLATDWRRSLTNRTAPKRYRLAVEGNQLNRVEIFPGGLTVLGAPPGAGKTALANQLLLHALAADETLRAVIANVEMTPHALLDRQLARLSGVPYHKVREREWRASDERDIFDAADEIEALLPRLTIMASPFTIERVRATADAHEANIVVVDYLQRFELARPLPDIRQHVSAVMSACRAIAMEGRAVVVISAIGRTSYGQGGGDLGAFRESSEIEYGADAAYLLVANHEDEGAAEREITLKCVKNRHGSRTPIPLTFHGAHQRFTAPDEPEDSPSPYPEFEGGWAG